MKFDEIKQLIQLAEKSELTHIEIKDKDFKITLKKEKETVMASTPVVAPVAPVAAQPVASVTPAEAPQGAVVEKPSTGKIIKAPMVGTFYGSSSPDAPAFVSVGDEVKKGQTVCILEAMKLMNEIESDFDGKIVKILVNNEDMVEYGQPLFEVE